MATVSGGIAKIIRMLVQRAVQVNNGMRISSCPAPAACRW